MAIITRLSTDTSFLPIAALGANLSFLLAIFFSFYTFAKTDCLFVILKGVLDARRRNSIC